MLALATQPPYGEEAHATGETAILKHRFSYYSGTERPIDRRQLPLDRQCAILSVPKRRGTPCLGGHMGSSNLGQEAEGERETVSRDFGVVSTERNG